MKVSVVGTGFVGLVTSACLAEAGHQVMGHDCEHHKIARLRAGELPIHEPGLQALVRRHLASGRLCFTHDPAQAARHGAVQLIAVGTPPGADGAADLQQLFDAADAMARHMRRGTVVVAKSTAPVGTTARLRARMAAALAQRGAAPDFAVLCNPEFLREGAAVHDFMNPDRVIVGGGDARALRLLRRLYAPFIRHPGQWLVLDERSAELAKYAANAMLATRISFMNELARLADALGADIEQVRQGIGSDPRIGMQCLHAGCGFGGSCLPKDLKALRRIGLEHGVELGVLAAVEAANERQKQLLVDMVTARFGDRLQGHTIAVWGLAFKPDTDDLREAPSCAMLRALAARGARLQAYDPVAGAGLQRLLHGLPGLHCVHSAAAALDGADALLVVTEWCEFRDADLAALKPRMRRPVVMDGRNLYEPARMHALGFEHHAVGRGAPVPLPAAAPHEAPATAASPR